MNNISKQILEKPLFSMTGAEIIELFSSIIPVEIKPEIQDYTSEKHLYGLDGLAKLLGVGKTKAQQLKNSGILDAAITQNGKTIIIDKDLALKLLKDNNNLSCRKP
ncbi:MULTISPECIES: DUF3853 family protein [Chryseobacterium]|uniref:DUF3853 family protein n=1 Tax=Chryseobacterium geocarposphaerae TaxID=1416776 RepID=A0ABU1LCX1_9FLAO|nr:MULTISPECIES: DUF3853 family protein [Chryseobacterium]MDR6404575.1 hypothetical protein [Chryseobacterium geocarposphaerae]MDR6698193.1 hypothetical protein [Chryseobacterium ginsenosidimutans]